VSQRNALLIQHCYSTYMEPSSLRKLSKTCNKCLFGPRGARFGLKSFGKCHCLVRLMITTHFGLVSGFFWAPSGPKRARFGPKCPRDQIWSQMSSGPNSRGRIGTSDNFYVLMTTGPEAVSLYFMVLHGIELYSIVLYGIACYFIVLNGTA